MRRASRQTYPAGAARYCDTETDSLGVCLLRMSSTSSTVSRTFVDRRTRDAPFWQDDRRDVRSCR